MPGIRKDGKKSKSVWLTQEERTLVRQIREALGLKDDGEAIKRAIQDLAKQKGIVK